MFSVQYLRISGIIFSAICLIIQTVLFILRPKIRQMDQKVLMQLAVTRLIHSMVACCYRFDNAMGIVVAGALYDLIDTSLRWWMCVYTKNLYEKMVKVFETEKWSFLKLSLVIWFSTIAINIVIFIFLYLFAPQGKVHYYDSLCAYTILWKVAKCIIICVNFLVFCKIFYVVMKIKFGTRTYKGFSNPEFYKNFAGVVKICVVSFFLVCITSLQILIDDVSVIAFAIDPNTENIEWTVAQYILAISSFQGVDIIIIFLILMKNETQ